MKCGRTRNVYGILSSINNQLTWKWNGKSWNKLMGIPSHDAKKRRNQLRVYVCVRGNATTQSVFNSQDEWLILAFALLLSSRSREFIECFYTNWGMRVRYKCICCDAAVNSKPTALPFISLIMATHFLLLPLSRSPSLWILDNDFTSTRSML